MTTPEDWRVAAMRAQLPDGRPIPYLAARPGLEATPGCCVSCGDELPQPSKAQARCEPCILAAWAALGYDAPT